MSRFAAVTLDLSRLLPPSVIDELSHESLYADFVSRFLTYWAESRAQDPSLPDFDVELLESDPVAIVGQAWSYLRLLDRARVNDVVRSLLAPLARGADLDNVVARQNIQRLVVREATSTSSALMETDEALLRRYLLSFSMASAGSIDRYLYEAWTAWPELHDARVNGHRVHGRPGDVDIVIIGPNGDTPTAGQRKLVVDACLADHVRPEATSVTVIDATRREFDVDLKVTAPLGPDTELVRQEIISRIKSAARGRLVIGGEIPADLISGAAYGSSVLRVQDRLPVHIESDPYTIPILRNIVVEVETVS